MRLRKINKRLYLLVTFIKPNKMLTKNTVKFVKSLQIKKFRKETESFFVEGAKSVIELLQSEYSITHLFGTRSFLDEHASIIKIKKLSPVEVKETDLVMLGTFSTNNAALAVAKTNPNQPLYVQGKEFILALDDVRDPGNLGTIIRIADWYGINKIVCSLNTADFYNPKVLHASMGSFIRVKLYYTDLKNYLSASKETVYGAFLDGTNIHKQAFKDSGIILMGNESNGIQENLSPFVSKRIHIPRFGQAESLNVGIATAIICDNIRRND
jgi:RNA methyltransferase, TrmH family